MRVLWILYVIVACVAAVMGFAGFMGANSAPQQSAAATIALASVAIPYLILRGIAEAVAVKEAQDARIQENIRQAQAANPKPETTEVDVERMVRASRV